MRTYTPDPEFVRQTRSKSSMAQSSAQNQGRPELLKFDANICEKFDPSNTDAHTWLHKFLAIATYCQWTNDQLCFYFGLHLLKDAYIWFSNLPEEISQNFEQLKEHFIIRFGLNGATKWSVLPEIYEMKQKHDQTVQDFIQKVQIKSKLIELPEDQIIGALMKGFLPHIRADLIRSDIKSIADVIKEATISEQVNKIKGPQQDSILSEERLIKAIQTAMTINNVQPVNQAEPYTQHRNQSHSNQVQHHQRNNFRKQQQNHTYNRRFTAQNDKVNPNYICFRCNKKGHHYQNQCPCIDTICYKCSKKGHIKRACKWEDWQ